MTFIPNKSMIGMAIAFLFSMIQMPPADTAKYKCMIQLTNYEGEGAYITVSILDQKDNYIQTLRVLGDDDEWYPDLTSWWPFFQHQDKSKADAITGATIAGGERSIFVLDIDKKYLTSEYKLRFETAVEDQKYHPQDLEVSMDPSSLKAKLEGTGYIRYVRMMPSGE